MIKLIKELISLKVISFLTHLVSNIKPLTATDGIRRRESQFNETDSGTENMSQEFNGYCDRR